MGFGWSFLLWGFGLTPIMGRGLGGCFFAHQFYAWWEDRSGGRKAKRIWKKSQKNGIAVIIRAMEVHVSTNYSTRVGGVNFSHLWGLRSAPYYGMRGCKKRTEVGKDGQQWVPARGNHHPTFRPMGKMSGTKSAKMIVNRSKKLVISGENG